MNAPKHGIFFIINNKTFDEINEATGRPTKLEERVGTDNDAEALEQLFTTIGYQVIRMNDLTGLDMIREIKKGECFVCSQCRRICGSAGRVPAHRGKIAERAALCKSVDY